MGVPRRAGRPTKREQLELAERRAKAVNLRKSGMQYADIAHELGYHDASHALKDINRAIREIPRADTEELVALELLRLDALLEAMWVEALGGSTWHVDRCLAISDRRARLLGLDQPTKVEVRSVSDLDAALFELEAELRAQTADEPVPQE